MRYWILALCASSVAFAQSSSATAAALANKTVAVFSIDPMSRGEDIVSMFATLSGPAYKTASSQIAIQTTRNALLPNIQSIQSATNSTILIFTYGQTFSPQYIAIPIEQIVEIIYSPQSILATSTFSSTLPGSILPIFSVDLSQRSSDIKNVCSILSTQTPYKSFQSKVGLQTTLSGPFYSPLVNGFIPNVQSISLTPAPNGTLMLVTYQPTNVQNYTIIVAPDQVYEIVFTR